MANSLSYAILNYLTTLTCCQHESPCCRLFLRTYTVAKSSSSLILTMAGVSRSDKLVNSIIICKIKVDNGHGLVAHSVQLPLYSTLFLISKLRITIVTLSINLSDLLKTTHNTINKKDWVFSHVFSPSQYCNMWFLLYVGLPTSALPAALQHMHADHFSQKLWLTYLGSKQYISTKSF